MFVAAIVETFDEGLPVSGENLSAVAGIHCS
jgi:hypothetical protein